MAKEEAKEIIIERPKRANITPEESLKRMEAFTLERKEKFVASVRKNKH